MKDINFVLIKWVAEKNKQYGTMEKFNHRAAQFKRVHEVIQNLNFQNFSSVQGHNFMSDWTHGEDLSLLGLK